MAEPPAPPFETTLSEQASDELVRQPELSARANAVVLRAANELRRQLEMGQNVATDLYGESEQLTVRVGLFPPNSLRIEEISEGGPAPEGATNV